MTEKIKNFRLSEKTVPWLLLLFTLAAYIPLVTQMGFYWDDWPMLWFKVVKGAEGFSTAFDSDRPFLGFLYRLTASLLSNRPLEWQILTVFFRWTVTLAFWWALRQLWPERKREVFWICLMLAVYPGFKQMPIVYVWMNALIMLLAYILSYGMMLKAMGSSSRKAWILWTVPSVLLFTFCTISTEYYTGLEVCRVLFIWIFLARSAEFRGLPFGKKAGKALLQWLPYLAVLAVFMFWRVFIFTFPSYQPVLLEELAANPLRAIFGVAVRAIEDAYTATWGAWTEFVRFPNHVDFALASGRIFWLAAGLSLAAALVVVFLYRPDEKKEEAAEVPSDRYWSLIAMGMGAVMVILPGFPYWVTTLPIRLTYPYDRFLVAFMFGSCIFMAGLISFFLRTRWQQAVVVSLFAAMAIGGNILNANSFRKDWNMQQDFAAQLVTRVPSLAQPTILLADDNPLSYESDNSLTGLVNLALDPQHEGDDLPYSVMLLGSRFGGIESFSSQEYVYQDFRGSLFGAKNDQVLVYHYAPPACLRIVDPERDSEILSVFPDTYKDFIRLSDISRIDTEGTAPTFLWDEVFTEPIGQNWCIYFQQAELARQRGDWETVAAIGDEVLPTMKAGDASEYLVYVEGYIKTKRWNEAMSTWMRIHDEDKGLDQAVCRFLHEWIDDEHKPPRRMTLDLIQAMNYIGCPMSED